MLRTLAFFTLAALLTGGLRLRAQTETDAHPVPAAAPAAAGQQQETPSEPAVDANKSVTRPVPNMEREIPDRDLRRSDLPVVTDLEAERVRQDADEQALFSWLDREIVSEPAGNSSSEKAVEQLKTAVTDEVDEMNPNDEHPALLSVLCQTNFCCLKFAHTEAGSPSELLLGIGQRVRWSGAVLVRRQDPFTTVLYLARPGRQLPRPQ